jgi:hypothetical protein
MARDFSAALGQVGRRVALLETGVPWRLAMAIGHIPVLSRSCILFPGFGESNSRFDPASGDVVLSRKPTFLLPEPSPSTRIWFLPGFFRENRDWRPATRAFAEAGENEPAQGGRKLRQSRTVDHRQWRARRRSLADHRDRQNDIDTGLVPHKATGVIDDTAGAR